MNPVGVNLQLVFFTSKKMAKKITKADIVDSIYSKGKCERQDVVFVIDSFLQELKESLEEGSTIELRGFGTFEPRLRKGKKSARNPKTGETVTVEPHYIAAFRAGQSLKDNLWNLNNSKHEK